MRRDVTADRVYLQGFRAYLDGIDVSDGCRWTDAERGEVGRYVRGPQGRLLIGRGQPVLEVLRGEAELRPRPILRRLALAWRSFLLKWRLFSLRAHLEKSDLI